MLDFAVCAWTNLFRILLVDRFASIFLGESLPEKIFTRKKGIGEEWAGKEGNGEWVGKEGTVEWAGEEGTGKKGKQKKRKLAVCAVFFVINTALFWEFHTAWLNILSNLLGIGAIVGLYTKSLRTNVFVTSSIYLINCGCDVAVYSLFTEYRDGNSYNQAYAVVVLFLILICEFLTERLITVRRDAGLPGNFPLILVPLCSISVICFLIYSGTGAGRETAIVSLGLLVINFLMLYLYNLLLRSLSQKYETAMLEQKVRVYAGELAIIRESEEKMKTLRHDLKHHLNEIKLLADREKVPEIQEYIERMESYIRNPDEIVSSGNGEIDSVLNYMLQKAREKLGTVTVRVMLPEKMKHDFDVNVLLGNLLENAIEAAVQTQQKYLKVDIAFKRGVLKIKIENSFLPGELQVRERRGNRVFLSSKKAEGQHGIGLESVRRIVEAHDGTMEAGPRDGLFCVDLLLYMPG